MKNTFICILLAFLAVHVNATPFDRLSVARNYHQLKDKAAKGKRLRVIVKVAGAHDARIISSTRFDRGRTLDNNRQKFSQLKNRLSRDNIRAKRELPRLGYMVMEVDSVQLDELIDSGLVDSVVEDIAVPPALEQSIPHIGADLAHASGYTGAGQAIVILDTGVDTTHPGFNGRVVEQACFSSNTSEATSLCPGQVEQAIGGNAGADCSGASSCYHGTHVAGIAAGSTGVAPAANIVSVQVFSLFDSVDSCGSASVPCVLSYNSDTLAALEWVLNEATTENIVSVNMSIGGGVYTQYCDDDSRASVIQQLRAAGIATVIASGNDGSHEGVSSPGCISDAITVGSTYNSMDRLSSYSNSSELVDLLAPGGSINSTMPGGGYASKSGTSMATPHVAGAFAVLRSANPAGTVDTMEFAFKSTGVDVTDSVNGVVTPRIDVDVAAATVVIGATGVKRVWPNGIDAVASAEQADNPAVNVGDGDLSTRWSAENAGQTITFNLGAVYDVSAVKIAFLKGDIRTTYFDVATSSDGDTFTLVASGLASSGSSTDLETFKLSGSAQFVQIIGQGNSTNLWNSLTEVEIWAGSLDASPEVLLASGLSVFDAEQNSQSIVITSNVDWTLASDVDWLSVSPVSGSGDGTSWVTVTENTLTDSRQATLTLSGGSIVKTITVAQAGKTVVSLDPQLLEISRASASADDGNVVGNTLDGDLGTRWSAKGDGQYATYDLGSIKPLETVNIAFYNGDSRTTEFSIAVSDDGVNFTTVLDHISSAGDSLSLEAFLLASEGRYVRFIGHGNSRNSWNSVTEIAFWGNAL